MQIWTFKFMFVFVITLFQSSAKDSQTKTISNAKVKDSSDDALMKMMEFLKAAQAEKDAKIAAALKRFEEVKAERMKNKNTDTTTNISFINENKQLNVSVVNAIFSDNTTGLNASILPINNDSTKELPFRDGIPLSGPPEIEWVDPDLGSGKPANFQDVDLNTNLFLGPNLLTQQTKVNNSDDDVKVNTGIKTGILTMSGEFVPIAQQAKSKQNESFEITLDTLINLWSIQLKRRNKN